MGKTNYRPLGGDGGPCPGQSIGCITLVLPAMSAVQNLLWLTIRHHA